MRPERPPWHARGTGDVIRELGCDAERGLDAAEAALRLTREGPNVIREQRRARWSELLARQFADLFIAILAVAALISLLVGEPIDAAAIGAILVLNGLLGFAQEWRAERAIQALRRLLTPHCRVVRDGREQTLETPRVAPGDLVLLEAGDRVPADLRLLATRELRVDESALTGESSAVQKRPSEVSPDTPLAERTSMAWMGTSVVGGRARGVAVATGMATEFGRIADLTETVATDSTPLQRELSGLGRQLGALAVGVSVVVGGIGWLLGRPALEMFLTGVSLAVAVVPEGLPAVVTVTLALGIRAMAQRRALLRRLSAAETLGAATVVCTDKTGTLTQNEMTVQRVWLDAGEVQATGVGYDPAGHFEADGERLDPTSRPDLVALLEAGVRCSDARLEREGDVWRIRGTPTEGSLQVAAAKAWIDLERRAAMLVAFPFSSERRRMTVVQVGPSGPVAYCKGAPEVLLTRCTGMRRGDETQPLDEDARERVRAATQELAQGGLRTLAIAVRELEPGVPLEADAVERDLELLGVVGILDPPRPEVADAVALAKQAGIHVLMITGDLPATAQAIARQIGLRADRAVTDRELAAMDQAALDRVLDDDVLFARAAPDEKLRIVTRLQARGHCVAMTGDGVNDAPALKKADIGIAMGVRGTDVARGAADMVLTDDNFASIIGAVEEGRRQYDNIRKFVGNLLSSNLGEVFAIFGGILIGGPLILLPAQILWVNLVTDGLTALALGAEPAERGVMQRPPRRPETPIVDRGFGLTLALMGIYVGLAALWLFEDALAGAAPRDVATARTVALTALIVLEIANALNFRALHAPLTQVGLFTNPWLLAAMAGSLALHAAVVYVPELQTLFHTAPLAWTDWLYALGLAVPLVGMSEVVKSRRRGSEERRLASGSDSSPQAEPSRHTENGAPGAGGRPGGTGVAR